MKSSYSRNIGALSLPQQRTLFTRSVLIVGCGGIGAAAAELLLRGGVETLILSDPARFAEEDLNRHPFATAATVGRYKVTETRQRLLSIAPNAKVIALKKPFPTEVPPFDLVLDCTDQPASHHAVGAVGVCPVLHAKAYGYLVTVYVQAVGEQRLQAAYPDLRPVRHPAGKLGLTDAFAASLLAAHAIAFLKQEEPPDPEGSETTYTLPYSLR